MMKKRTAILFAGQGAQKVGMGKDLAEADTGAAELFAKADSILGRALSKVTFDGPEDELTRTGNCQPALYVHGLALFQMLRARLPELEFHAAAGLSLGEFTAHAAAGTFSFEDGLKLVARRGELMDEACQANPSTMAACIGGEEEKVRELAAACDVDVANLNAPGQIVLSGSKEGIAQVLEQAKDFGCRKAVELPVAGAYHSRLMQSAREGLETKLAETTMKPPQVVVVSNYTAQPVSEPAAIRQSLADQVTGSVRWSHSMELLMDEDGIERFIELGPGGVLAGLLGRIRKGTEVVSIGDLESFEAGVATLQS